jgi:hypothetical protein
MRRERERLGEIPIAYAGINEHWDFQQVAYFIVLLENDARLPAFQQDLLGAFPPSRSAVLERGETGLEQVI